MSPQPNHFVVDGSNIATEGRSMPSLAQLNEAVLAFMKQYPDVVVTVIVDATFGHRIDQKERKAFDEGVANNELVAPPAGAIGRGDAFVLTIADQSGAGVLSNDSFQEFHGDYPWLFDEGRLVGGKPVPNVGWVFVPRTPVRGQKSRDATRGSRRKKVSPDELQDAKRQAASRVRKRDDSDGGQEQADTGKARKSGSSRRRSDKAKAESGDGKGSRSARSSSIAAPKSAKATYVNELMPFIDFVEQHPVGTDLVATVDRYSSHGSYLTADGVSLYLPLQYMGDPAPSSARSVIGLGDEVRVVVVGFQPERRSVDVAIPDFASTVLMTEGAAAAGQGESSPPPPEVDAATDAEHVEDASAGATDDVSEGVGTDAPDKKTATKKTATKKTVTKKTATKKAETKKAAAKKVAAKKTATKKTPAKKTDAKKTATKKAETKKAAAKKTATKKTPAKKAATKETATKKVAAKKAPGKKMATKKTATKKTATKKAAAKKTAAESSDVT